MPQPAGSFSILRIGQGLTMSKRRNSKKPPAATSQIRLVVIEATIRNVSACPANSSATTSRGSVFPVIAITAGPHRMQTAEPAIAITAIAITTAAAEAPQIPKRRKIITGGSEPHVPGAPGSRPSPKHDAKILFIAAKG